MSAVKGRHRVHTLKGDLLKSFVCCLSHPLIRNLEGDMLVTSARNWLWWILGSETQKLFIFFLDDQLTMTHSYIQPVMKLLMRLFFSRISNFTHWRHYNQAYADASVSIAEMFKFWRGRYSLKLFFPGFCLHPFYYSFIFCSDVHTQWDSCHSASWTQ